MRPPWLRYKRERRVSDLPAYLEVADTDKVGRLYNVLRKELGFLPKEIGNSFHEKTSIEDFRGLFSGESVSKEMFEECQLVNSIYADIASRIVQREEELKLQFKNAQAQWEGRYEETRETVICTGHYTNQALRTLKRMQNKAVEWKLLRDVPKFRLSKAPGRDRMIDERAEDELEQAYLEPVEHGRIKRLRQQAWLVVVILQDSGMRPDEVFPMRIENIYWDQNRIWVPEGKTDNATRFVPMSDRMKIMLGDWCGSRREGWVFPSSRSKSGHLTTIAKGFQAARGRAGLDKKVVPYSARHTYGTYTMEKSGNAFAVSKSMGHADLKSMEPYQHQELEPLRIAINQRNRRKKFGQVFGQVLENAS